MTVRILQGDIRAMLATLPDESVHCVVTSPPYWGLRDYGTGVWDGGDPDCDHIAPPRGGRDPATSSKQITNAGTLNYQFSGDCGKCGAKRIDNQLGLEPTLAEHIETMVSVFREVRRVLRKDGTVWLNYGDCYAGSNNTGGTASLQGSNRRIAAMNDATRSVPDGLKPKDLCMIPNRLAIALQDAGWWVRSEIIWAKPNPMPESVTDRPATAHEKVWLLSKSARYFYDAEAVRRPIAAASVDRLSQDVDSQQGSDRAHAGGKTNGSMKAVGETSGANLRNVWTIATAPFSEAHFATFPPKLAETCIKAGTSEKGCCAECGAPWVRETEAARPSNYDGKDVRHGNDGGNMRMKNKWDTKITTLGWSPSCACNPLPPDATPDQLRKIFRASRPIPCTILDPFIGSGTTALVADRLQRDCIGIDLNTEYAEMAIRRIKDDAGMFAEVIA